MNTKNKSKFGVFIISFIFVLAGALFAFSISVASETEAVDPTTPEELATEEALAEDPVSEEVVVEEATEEPSANTPLVAEEPSAENDIAEPVGGPLTVLNSAGQLATTEECE